MSGSAGAPAADASAGHGGAVVTAPGALLAGVGTAGDPPAERVAGAGDGPDLRLAGLAVAAWLAALASLHLSARSAALLAAGAAGLAALVAAHLLGWLGRPAGPVRRLGWIAVA
ncbi:hypothetical protein QLR68_28690, partial [Micromonospora sp. DH15]|nr:hypothetical protein [Micromonospora sp. DH15]